jgi:hypothetical protein
MTNKNSFLPDNYELPTSEGGYLRFKQGENRFRIMSSPILGYEYWTEEDGNRKPNRVRMEEQVDISQVPNPEELKHFWAMVVWNYDANRLQILQLTQKGIMKSLKALTADEDWGNPKGKDGYDIVITREGEGLETEYQVSPKPKKELGEKITNIYKEAEINLDALYGGEDPFAKSAEKKFDNEIDEIFDSPSK